MQGIIDYFPEQVKVSRPEGGYILWIELNKNINAYKLYQEAMKYHISIAPGQLFSLQGNYRNYIRIGFGKKYDDQTEYGLKMLGALVKRM
jgi:DNA-binding transcriptional MocR family regulator